jgi:hypothetical protein
MSPLPLEPRNTALATRALNVSANLLHIEKWEPVV